MAKTTGFTSKEVSFEHNGKTYTVRRRFVEDALTALEDEKFMSMVKAQTGAKQWKVLTESYDGVLDAEDIDAFTDDMLKAMGVDLEK